MAKWTIGTRMGPANPEKKRKKIIIIDWKNAYNDGYIKMKVIQFFFSTIPKKKKILVEMNNHSSEQTYLEIRIWSIIAYF